MHTKESKYLTELHGEAGRLNKFERQKGDKLLLYPRIKSPLYEQVRTRMVDFPWRYCARRIRAETHISL